MPSITGTLFTIGNGRVLYSAIIFALLYSLSQFYISTPSFGAYRDIVILSILDGPCNIAAPI